MQTMTVSVHGISVASQLGLISLASDDGNLTTATNFMNYIASIDAAVSIISTDRGKYAAAVNRLDHAIANMQNVATNLSMAKGIEMPILQRKRPILRGSKFYSKQVWRC